MNFLLKFFNGDISQINLQKQKIKHYILVHHDIELYNKLEKFSNEILEELDKENPNQ